MHLGSSVLQIQDLSKFYTLASFFKVKGTVRALEGVSLELKERETLAIVGESGCGKTTLAKTLMGIEKPTSGSIVLSGGHQEIQMVFQDPYGSLNPRKRIWQIVAEPLIIRSKLSKAECKEEALKLLEQVGIRRDQADRYPHMFSGGQRQRIAIARALILKPKVLLLDEPVSALDVSIQAQILNLLLDLQEKLGVSYLFISHDLSVVRHVADRVAVLYLGKVVELGPAEEIFLKPKHPYTQSLLRSVLPLRRGWDRQIRTVSGEPPSPLELRQGCAFQSRCPIATGRCSQEALVLRPLGEQSVACHFA